MAAWCRKANWFQAHFYFMSWSVVGLYAALWSEIGTRFTTNMKRFLVDSCNSHSFNSSHWC